MDRCRAILIECCNIAGGFCQFGRHVSEEILRKLFAFFPSVFHFFKNDIIFEKFPRHRTSAENNAVRRVA